MNPSNSTNPYKPLSTLPGLYSSLTAQAPAFNAPKPIKSTAMGVPAKSPLSNQNQTADLSNIIPRTQAQNMSTTTPAVGGIASPQWTGSVGVTPKPVTPSLTPVDPTNVTQTASAVSATPAPATSAPQTNPSYPGLVNSLANTGLYGTPQVNDANKNLLDFQKQYANYQNAVGTEANPFGFETGVGQLAQNRYAQELPAYQQAVQNALTSQGQRIGALGTAAGQSAPANQFGVLTNPFTAQPVSGGTPQAAAFSGGQVGTSQSLGGQYQSNQAAIQGAESLGKQFISQVSAVPDFNAGSVNFGNAINQLLQNNYSNPNYPGIQSTFNNIINAYAPVLGSKDQVAQIIKSANPTSMQALISSLDSQAKAVQQGIYTTGTGQGSEGANGSVFSGAAWQ